jgi:hypothetical protein
VLKKISTAGGATVTLCDLNGTVTGGAWTRDGHLIVGIYGEKGGLYRVHENGGEATLLTAPPTDQFALYRWPHLLPGERTVLFTAYRPSSTPVWALADAESETMALSLDRPGAEPRTIPVNGTHAQYAASGHLVVGSAGSLLAVPFDPNRLEVRGTPVRVATGVRQKLGTVDFALSPDGALVYLSAGSAGSTERELVWTDAEGREEALAAPPREYEYPRLSPDGRRIAFYWDSAGQADLWSWDLERGAMNRLTSDVRPDQFPTWTPDGRDLVFASGLGAEMDLYRMPIDGTAAPRLLLDTPGALRPCAVSPNGRHLVYRQGNASASVLDLAAPEDDPVPLGVDDMWSADFSPDGRFLVYDEGVPGQDMQIHVVAFPDPGRGRWQITDEGGRDPVWSRDGREIYYRSMGLVGEGAIMAVEIRTSPAFTAGRPREVLRLDYYRGLRRSFDVAPGPRFLILRRAEERDPRTRPQVVLVHGFLDELRRLVPVD